MLYLKMTLMMIILFLIACGGSGVSTKQDSSEAHHSVASSSSGSVYPPVLSLSSSIDSISSASAVSSDSSVPESNALVTYHFDAGDTLATKNGWSFAKSDWLISSISGATAKGLEFTFDASRVGAYTTSELRFVMPPSNDVWLKIRLHVPQNFEHRSDTFVRIPVSEIQTWQVGDQVYATDGQTAGIISEVVREKYGEVPATGIFLRNPPLAWSNAVWVGALYNASRNEVATSTGRQMWSANNKLLSLWTDGYSAKGLGSSVAFEFWPKAAAYGTSANASELAVHYSSGNYTVMGAHLEHAAFITATDRGKFIDLIFHVKLSSATGAKDGVIETFLRRESEPAFTRIHNITNADMDPRIRGNHAESNWVGNPQDLQPFQRGYLMGWSNSSYDKKTSFFISRIEYFQQMPIELE